jgi:hypothetical protein
LGTVGTAQLGNINNIWSGNSALSLQTGSVATTAMTISASQSVGIGTTIPIRQLTVSSPNPSTEFVVQNTYAQANGRNWRFLVDGGNGSTNSSFTIDGINDAGTVANSNGIVIDGTTGVFSTKTVRKISAASVPAGTVIQTQWNNFTVGYTGTSASYVQVTAFNQTFTPLYASSKVYVTFNTGINLICDGSVALTRNGSIIKDTWFGSSRQDDQYDYPQASGFYLDSPGTTSTVTYGIQVRASGCGNTIRIGGSDNHQSFTFMEIAA